MEDTIYNNFNATRCNVCFTRATEHRLTLVGIKLRYCKGCRLIGYCGEQHQKEDWKHHKDFCRVVTKVLTIRKIDHILDVRTECPRIVGGTRRDLECAISLAECLIISMLQRNLKTHEYMMLRFPNICRVCLDYDTTKLKACESCHQVLYCSEEHRLQDVDRHGRWCQLYRVNLLLDAGECFDDSAKLLKLTLIIHNRNSPLQISPPASTRSATRSLARPNLSSFPGTRSSWSTERTT